METPANLFTACFKDFKTGGKKHFVIHESQNDLIPLIKFLKALIRCEYWLVGFNCNMFDAQIIEYLLNHYPDLKRWPPEQIAEKIHDLAQRIINLSDEDKFQNLIPEWKFQIPHIDVYKQCHFDGKQKRCSLKWLEFTMRFPNIESMPIHHSERVEGNKIPLVLGYNYNDVDATDEFFKRIQFESELRFTLSQEYGLNLINASEPRMAREIFGKFLSEQMGVSYRELKERRTYRKRIYVKDLIFPYVKFKDPVLQGAKDFFMKLHFDPYHAKDDNSYHLKKVEKIFKYHTIPEVTIGLGGIHGCTHAGIYESTKDWCIHDIDATSYYPNLGIKNKLFPEHLSEDFCIVYENLFNMRQEIPKENPINYIFKIILNSTYGLSKEMNNYFHDPNYTYATTINGQLLLLMLAQLLKERIPELVFYQFNTDGVTIGYPRQHQAKVKECMRLWTLLTKIKLEDKFYTKMVIVDVNNYMAVDEKGKVKRKGLFGYSLNPEDKEMGYHNNPSALVVPKALEQYFIYGKSYEDYIHNEKDIFEFCHGVKVKRDFRLWKHFYNPETNRFEKEKLNQQVVRYYCSHEPMKLKKVYSEESKTPRRVIELEKGWTMTYYNKHVEKPIEQYDIDYKYYIKAVRDVISVVSPHATQIKMF